MDPVEINTEEIMETHLVKETVEGTGVAVGESLIPTKKNENEEHLQPIVTETEILPPLPPTERQDSPKGNNNIDTKPEDIRYLTIKNLDTGEEFIIGENDPDFDFDTFEIGARLGDDPTNNAATQENQKQERISWWKTFFNYIYGNKKENIDEKVAANVEGHSSSHGNNINKPKTPFTKLSSFRFRKELGRGAFGRVLLAEAKTDGKLYALKIISKKNMRSSDRRQAKAERDILHCMTLKAPHPFTSGLKFAFQSENHLYLGMDYIPGGNLRELIKRFKYLPQDWVQFYAAELILAISHLHSLNVLYRDIKPHNVMIDARGHLILIDFGLSKQEITHPRGALSLVGTPDYSAPEVLRTGVQQIEAHNREKALRAKQGKRYKGNNGAAKKEEEALPLANIGYGKAADWWSLGIMIYEMIAGKPTFRGQDLRETYQKILYAKLEFNPEERFSPEAKLLLEGLINRDPQLRLGAWENPPKDIMSSAFFSNVRWDAIFERRQDGPWLPDLPGFYRRSMVSNPLKPAAEDNSDPTYTKIDFTPAPYHRITEDPNNLNDANNKPQRRTTVDNVYNRKASTTGEEEEDDDDDDDEEEFTDDEPEELAVRDSVFISNQNEVPGWSYIDEGVLMSYISSLAEKKEEKLEKEKRKNAKKEKKLQKQLLQKKGTEGGENADELVPQSTNTGENVINEGAK